MYMPQMHPKLQIQVSHELTKGWMIESATQTAVVLTKGHDTSHLLHLILSVITCGLWIPIWIATAVFTGKKTQKLWINQRGELKSSNLWA